MANEDKKDFNGMLHDSKDMPKFQTITDKKSIEKYGGDRMYFAPPIDYDKVMRQVPRGMVLTVGKIREYFARESGADFTEPITAGIFVSIVAWASYQRAGDETPYRKSALNKKLDLYTPDPLQGVCEYLFMDLHALMNNEIFYSYQPLYLRRGIQTLSEEELRELDCLAELLAGPDKNMEKIEHLWTANEKFSVLTNNTQNIYYDVFE